MVKTKQPCAIKEIEFLGDSAKHAELIMNHDPLGFENHAEVVEYALRDYLAELTKSGSFPNSKTKIK